MPEPETITPTALHALSRTRPVRLIDVRTPGEFARAHAAGAENVPARRFDPAALDPAGPVYLICRGGSRAAAVCVRLASENPAARGVVVAGGTLAWEAAGLPVVRPRDWRRYRRWSNRVGMVWVLVSVLLAVFVHSGLLGLAGFAGAALIINQMIINHFLKKTEWAFDE